MQLNTTINDSSIWFLWGKPFDPKDITRVNKTKGHRKVHNSAQFNNPELVASYDTRVMKRGGPYIFYQSREPHGAHSRNQ